MNVEIFTLLGFYAAQIGILLPTGCRENSATKYQYTLREVPQERGSDLHLG
jgi:hypothetical protein